MSDTIDRRIVEMRFDNKDFERNISGTLISLETLQKALQFQDSQKGFENIQRAASDVNLSEIQNGVDETSRRFTALEIVAITTLSNITNTAVNAGKRLIGAFVNPLFSGGKQRAQNMAQAKFMFSGLGYAAEQIGGVGKSGTIMDNLYKSVEGTFYSLDKAALVGSQLMAAGIEGTSDEITRILKGVAGVSSMFGADYQRVGDIFAKVKTQGKLMGQDLMSLNSYGVPTIAKITEYLNSMGDGATYTQEQVSEMVSKGKVDFEMFSNAMSMAFGDQAAKSKQLFTGAFEDMVAAMARVGEKMWKPILDFGREFFNATVPLIDNINTALTPAFDKFGRIIDSLKSKVVGIVDFISALFDFDATVEALTNLAKLNDEDMDIVLVDDERLARLQKYKDKIQEVRETILKVLEPVKTLFNFLSTVGSKGINIVWEIFKALATGVTNLGSSLGKLGKNGATILDSITNAIVSFVEKVAPAIEKITGVGIPKVLNGIRDALAGFGVGDIIKSFGSVMLGLGSYKVLGSVKNFTDVCNALVKTFKTGGLSSLLVGGSFSNLNSTMWSLQNTLKVYQNSLNSKNLMVIATAILELAIAVRILSNIDSGKLGQSVIALGALFGELVYATQKMNNAKIKGLIQIAIAVRILVGAVKQLSELSGQELARGLGGVAALLGELTLVASAFDKFKIKPAGLAKASLGLIGLALAIRLLIKPVKELGSMDTEELKQGLLSLAGILAGLDVFLFIFAKAKVKPQSLIPMGIALIAIATAIRMLIDPIKQLGSMDLKTLGVGLGAIGAILLEIVGFSAIMGSINKASGGILKGAAALLIMSVGVQIMANALNKLSKIPDAGPALSTMFASLLILASAMHVMKSAVAGAAAMIIVAGALAIMAPSIALLSQLKLSGVAIGLLALAGAIGIFAGAALLLAPVIPLMIALGAAFALLGVGILGIGTGLTMLLSALAMGTGIILDAVATFSEALPVIAKAVRGMVVTVLDMLVQSMPQIKEFLIEFVDTLLLALDVLGPKIIDSGFKLLLNLLSGIDQHLDAVVDSAVKIIIRFANAIGRNLGPIIDAGFDLMINFFLGISKAIEVKGPQLITAIEDVLLAVLEVLVREIPIFGDTAADAIREYRDGLKDQAGLNDVGDAAKDVADTADKNLKIKDQTDNGDNATKGIIRGLNKSLPQLRTTAKTIADIVDETVKKRNQIESPSKRLYNSGRYIMMGLINGVSSLEEQYKRKANNISTVMIGSANRSIDSIYSLMSASSSTLNMAGVNADIRRHLDIETTAMVQDKRQEMLLNKLEEMFDQVIQSNQKFSPEEMYTAVRLGASNATISGITLNGRELKRSLKDMGVVTR